jgi:hypothetical protein
MSEYTAKFASTSVVWLAIACVLVFGVSRSMNDQFLMFLTTIMLGMVGAGATHAVWQRGKVNAAADKKSGVEELA